MKAIGWSRAAAVGLVLSGIVGPAMANEKTMTVKVDSSDRKVVWVQTRAKSWDTEHKTWVQRGGYVGYRIPDDKFTTYYGPQHTFRINTLPYRMVDGEHRFQSNGYWMTVVDPWPETWSDGWYDNDDVYVKYDNGYYLYNTKYPDVGLSLRFSKP